jgi:hypothetical protein
MLWQFIYLCIDCCPGRAQLTSIPDALRKLQAEFLSHSQAMMSDAAKPLLSSLSQAVQAPKAQQTPTASIPNTTLDFSHQLNMLLSVVQVSHCFFTQS